MKISWVSSRLGIIIGAIFAIGFLLVGFSPLYTVNSNLNTTIVTPLTTNATAFITSDGSLPRYGGFWNFGVTNIFWIVLGLVVVAIILIVSAHSGEDNG